MCSPSCLLVLVSLLGLRSGVCLFSLNRVGELAERWQASPLSSLSTEVRPPTNINRQLSSVIPELRQSPIHCMAGSEPTYFKPQGSRLRASPSAILPIAWGTSRAAPSSSGPSRFTSVRSTSRPIPPIEMRREEGKNDRLKSSVFLPMGMKPYVRVSHFYLTSTHLPTGVRQVPDYSSTFPPPSKEGKGGSLFARPSRGVLYR